MQQSLVGGTCDPCRTRAHERCDGWDVGWCGCTSGLCGLRLLTGVMWDTNRPEQEEEP